MKIAKVQMVKKEIISEQLMEELRSIAGINDVALIDHDGGIGFEIEYSFWTKFVPFGKHIINRKFYKIIFSKQNY